MGIDAKRTSHANGGLEVDFPEQRGDSANGVRLGRLRPCFCIALTVDRLRTDTEQVTLVLAPLAHGCLVCAIVFAFGLDERTVRDWEHRAGHHSGQVHQHLVQRPRDLGQVQADEIRVKMQTRVVWLAMALQVSTRLWLGAVISEHRDETLVSPLMQRVRGCFSA